MVIDNLSNLEKYANLNPLFPKVIEFLKNNDLASLEPGKHVIDGKDLFVNILNTPGKTKEAAVMETHNNMLDIQIPINVDETFGYTPTDRLPQSEYNAEKDVTKYPGVEAEAFITCHPGMMGIFWPQDGHQPCISDAENIHKAVFKVKC